MTNYSFKPSVFSTAELCGHWPSLFLEWRNHLSKLRVGVFFFFLPVWNIQDTGFSPLIQRWLCLCAYSTCINHTIPQEKRKLMPPLLRHSEEVAGVQSSYQAARWQWKLNRGAFVWKKFECEVLQMKHPSNLHCDIKPTVMVGWSKQMSSNAETPWQDANNIFPSVRINTQRHMLGCLPTATENKHIKSLPHTMGTQILHICYACEVRAKYIQIVYCVFCLYMQERDFNWKKTCKGGVTVDPWMAGCCVPPVLLSESQISRQALVRPQRQILKQLKRVAGVSGRTCKQVKINLKWKQCSWKCSEHCTTVATTIKRRAPRIFGISKQ